MIRHASRNARRSLRNTSRHGAGRHACRRRRWRLDNDFDSVYDDELLLDVERLNIDSASFVQMEGQGDVAAQILETVRTRGKQHNPVTGSGGMLLGRVARVGAALAELQSPLAALADGDRVATLVSLTLTPLRIDRIVVGRSPSVTRWSSPDRRCCSRRAWRRSMPADLPESVALAAFDVAGAAPQVARMTKPGRARAHPRLRRQVGPVAQRGRAPRRRRARRRRRAQRSTPPPARAGSAPVDEIVLGDANDAVGVAARAMKAAGGEFDLAVSCVNVPDAEMAAILATRDGGVIYYFSMSTSFTKAALGAEGVSRDVTMIVGNGYAPGHAEATLALLRAEPVLREIFVERYQAD